ncbi:hypothetical protein AwWohl_04860 [Gammaproteobacteria bacterium]|nr:hypothetical protein AwWohl_04860 [Gammaproteobacteria bacterium]
MKPFDYVINIILSGILIVGVYQFYFFTQRNPLAKVREFNFWIDEKIPFLPSWAWLYSFLYYPAILYVNWLVIDARHFSLMAFTYVILLLMQMIFFMLFPVRTPAHWREINTGRSLSERFLRFVQKFDGASNCFPSMHVSVAMLSALFAFSALGPFVFLFPLLIALSCAFTKQHYLMDLPAGAFLGWIAYQVYLFIV